MPTVTEIQERLALYKTAERKILEANQEYRINNRTFTRANLAEVQRMIDTLEQQLAQANNSGRLGHSITVFGGRR